MIFSLGIGGIGKVNDLTIFKIVSYLNILLPISTLYYLWYFII